MAKSTVRLLVIVAATLVTSVACAARGSYDRQLSAPPGGRLTFITNVGSVTVLGRSTHEVTVHAELHGGHAFLTHLHISAERTASGVTITAHASHGWFHFFNFGWHRVRFTVDVPSDYPVHLSTSGGDVTVRDLNASVRARTSGGDAHAQNVTGTLNLQTSGGDVGIRNIKGELNVSTSGGDIAANHLKGPATLSSSGGDIQVVNSKGKLELSTSGGDLRLRNTDGAIHALTSGGDIRAQIPANLGIAMRSAGGDIFLLLPKGTRATLDAQSDGGDVTSEFPIATVQTTAGSQLQGTIGGGGPPITLHASGGDIHIGPES